MNDNNAIVVRYKVTCTGLRGPDNKTPEYGPFNTYEEAERFANWGHFCFAWHRITTIKETQP